MSGHNGARRLLGALVLLLVVTAASADTLRRKNGQTLRGKVERYSNGEFVIRLESGDRMIVAADNVESVEFDSGGFAVTPPSTASEKVVTLDSSQEVAATGVQLRKGDRVRITASGQMQFADGRSSGPGGRNENESWPFPGTPFGMLVAMVGSPTSPTYEPVGESKEFAAASDGELFLQINARSLAGARGAYTARIAVLTTTAPPTTPTPITPGSPSTPSQPDRRPLRYDIQVPSEKAWTDTGIDLLEGDTLRITAAGTINYTTSKTCGPEGGKREWGDLLKALPVNDVGRGALVGLIGESGVAKAFLVGAKLDATVPAKGRLFLGINDDNFDTNRGSFKVRIEIVPVRR